MTSAVRAAGSNPSQIRFSTVLVSVWCFWLATLGIAYYLKARIHDRPTIDFRRLDTVIPEQFGEWSVIANGAEPIVNPQLTESLRNVYDDTLNRTYQNRITGSRVMISLAYGRDQSHDKQVHKPEVCYPAQGFMIDSVRKTTFRVADHPVPVTTLHAVKGPRSEFVAYWIVEGDSIVRGALQQNFHRTLNALQGIKEDGLLFRISLISNTESDSIVVMREFADALVRAEDLQTGSKLIGVASKSRDANL